MRKLLALITCSLLLPTITFAETMARILPVANQAMISLYRGRIGGSDANAKFLFESMNVPAQNGLLGPGKSIKDSRQALSWVCGDKGADGFQCTMMIQNSSVSTIRSNPVRVKFEVTGQEAQYLFSQVVPNMPDGSFEFKNDEQTLHITIAPQTATLTYAE